MTKADFAIALANYDENKDGFMLDELLKQIPSSLHLEAYKMLKLTDGYTNIATLNKIVSNMRSKLNIEIRSEAEQFADSLLRKITVMFELLTRQNSLQDFKSKFDKYNWKDLQVNNEPFFNEKEAYLLNNIKLDFFKLYYETSEYKTEFIAFYEDKKKLKLGFITQQQNLLGIANLAKLKKLN